MVKERIHKEKSHQSPNSPKSHANIKRKPIRKLKPREKTKDLERLKELMNPAPENEPSNLNIEKEFNEIKHKNISKAENNYQEMEPENELNNIQKYVSDSDKGSVQEKNLYEADENNEIIYKEMSDTESEEASEFEEEATRLNIIEGMFNKDDSDSEDLEEALKQIDEEDKTTELLTKHTKVEDIAKSKGVQAQIKLWNMLIGYRILIQRILNEANQLPQFTQYQGFIISDKEVSQSYENVIHLVYKLIHNLCKIQNKLFQYKDDKSQDKEILFPELPFQKIEDPVDQKNIDIWGLLGKGESVLDDYLEENINKWNKTTQLHSGDKKGKKNKIANFGGDQQLILNQINKMMENEETIRKTQQKRVQYKVIGKGIESLEQKHDEEIYDDYDYYQLMLKDFVGTQGIEPESNISYNKYKKDRKESKKECDRKASKNRKIRYDVHEKIVNFIPRTENLELMRGSDNILKSLFGVRKGESLANKEEFFKKPKFNMNLDEISDSEESDGIQFIQIYNIYIYNIQKSYRLYNEDYQYNIESSMPVNSIQYSRDTIQNCDIRVK